MAIATDGSTPAVVAISSGGATSYTTASFSPPANSLICVLVTAAKPFPTSGSVVTSVVVTDSGSHTWTAGPSVYGPGPAVEDCGVAVVSYCYFPTAPGAITVTATFDVSVSQRVQVATRVLTGAAATQTGAGSNTKLVAKASKTTDGTISVTTTVVGSLVFGIAGGIDPLGGSISHSVIGGTSQITTNGVSLANTTSWKQTTATTTPGATTFGGNWSVASAMAIAALEMLPVVTATFAPPPESLMTPYRLQPYMAG